MRPNCAGIWHGNEKKGRVPGVGKQRKECRGTSGERKTRNTENREENLVFFPRHSTSLLYPRSSLIFGLYRLLDIGPRSNRRCWFIRLNRFHTFLTAKVSKKK